MNCQNEQVTVRQLLQRCSQAKPNCQVGRIITISKALNRDLSYAFGEKIGKILIYPGDREGSDQQFWKQIDSYYLNPKGRSTTHGRKSISQWVRLITGQLEKIISIYHLDVVEKFSNHLNISPLNPISKPIAWVDDYTLGSKTA